MRARYNVGRHAAQSSFQPLESVMPRLARIFVLAAFLFMGIGLGPAGCASSQNDSSASPGMFDGPNTVSFKVEGMACRNCAKEIARELEDVPGVKAATIDFDTATAKVSLDPNDPASMDSLNAAVEHWRTEHFSVKEDPQCLDPKKREELQNSGG
jgi:copper chaperone CopZ